MSNWDDADHVSEYDKWANWSMNQPRKSDHMIKYASAFVFMLTAGTNMIGLIG